MSNLHRMAEFYNSQLVRIYKIREYLNNFHLADTEPVYIRQYHGTRKANQKGAKISFVENFYI